MFAAVGDLLSANPEHIAMAVNLMSGLCSAGAAALTAWSTMMLADLAMHGRSEEEDADNATAIHGAGLVAGLSTAFITSVYFSGVEGEVYAMSTFFTALTIWSMVKFYFLPDGPKADRYAIFALFSVALSVGVHLLSLLTLPALALLFYYKKFKKRTILGGIAASVLSLAIIGFIQKAVIVGIPTLWSHLDLMMVNSFGAPFLSGIIPTVLIVGAILAGGLWYAHKSRNQWLQYLFVAVSLICIGFSTFGVVVIRANANPPVNMNNPEDPMRLIPYLNREQYGERALLRGPDFTVDRVKRYNQEERYGQVDDRYEIVDYKLSPEYSASDMKLFPRMQDGTQGRPELYRRWIDKERGSPTLGDNISFFFKYQVGWMYRRYFMWNFVGRQNGTQGFFAWNKKDGNWLSGVGPIDSWRLYNQSNLPSTIAENKQRNTYFFIPLLIGLLGLIWHYSKNRKDFLALLALFIITGIGIIVYSNSPPNEPRERDYAVVGSFMTFCMWIGMGVVLLYELLKNRLAASASSYLSIGIGLLVPIILLTQNFDDHSRRHHTGARDYANNFLQSCDENAIIFTYGDNDTYPLWYAQEVENIRRDVRVVNLSLINVDWYIDQLRRKVNESAPIKMSIPPEKLRGYKRNQVQIYSQDDQRPVDIRRALAIVAKDQDLGGGPGALKVESIFPSHNVFLPIDKQRALNSGMVNPSEAGQMVDRINFNIPGNFVLKGDLAVLDIIANNFYDRPIYFSVTTQEAKLLGAKDNMQLEGLSLRLVPFNNPSDPNFLIYGSGRVAADKIHDRMKNKFKWGNFDKYDMYVDHSYGPSVGALRMMAWRTMNTLLSEQKAQKAEEVIDIFFTNFPHKNFPYDARVIPFIRGYLTLGKDEKAKEHLRILANEADEFMLFFDSLSATDLASWERDQRFWISAANQVLELTKLIDDQAFKQEMEDKLGAYRYTRQQLQN